MNKLLQTLKRIDGNSYKAYKDIRGTYEFNNFTLYIDHVQGDPFAAPSKIRLVIPTDKRALKDNWFQERYRQTAAEDTLARSVSKAIRHNRTTVKGSGKSGRIQFDAPHQEVLERSAVQITPEKITVCLSVGLPANGRRINGGEAIKLLTDAMIDIMKHSILTVKDETIESAVQLADQQQAIRKEMSDKGWIAFIANGSILPRESGISDRPMNNAVPFQSPPELETEISVPHQASPVKGMAVGKGITLIVGGGYHGKSTLLQAIERGIYHHIAEDGREYVLTDPDAVKIRAEDGRNITGVNISPFINNLPHGQDTHNFSTENASGSTSQAANVMEALETGASILLVDEDTSATNFMIRDHRMQELVHKDKEPITPFIQKIKQLSDDLDVSTMLVMGGSGDYFSVADTVIMMDEYLPYDVTQQAKKIMEADPLKQNINTDSTFGPITHRSFDPKTLQTQKGKRSKTQAKGQTHILMGRTDISFNETEQLVDASQTRMIAEIIQHLEQRGSLKGQTLNDMLDEIESQIDQKGLASFTPFPKQHPGDLARPRRHEIAAVFNRMRTALVIQA
ncbi:hypothetical protein JNUCC1_00467 [Lentibacillus sp. JNUCC-1]|uniref:ABC-ATPase domain-containing protein n=1 Tax=Lentibacillus sp. JNUCC-1 TaxID=2654513 RepID=UPI0012E6F987|nr:ABC-ATPase domain-containing protein [Lentibacillus sp. JNUCC-1]MUV36664.1 hypothetical protein [Lentibacillus sp. JNUCC-1]